MKKGILFLLIILLTMVAGVLIYDTIGMSSSAVQEPRVGKTQAAVEPRNPAYKRALRKTAAVETEQNIRFILFCNSDYENNWVEQYMGQRASGSSLSGMAQTCSTFAKEVQRDSGLSTAIVSQDLINTTKGRVSLFYPQDVALEIPTGSMKANTQDTAASVTITGEDNIVSAGPERSDVMFFAGHGFPGKLALWNKGQFAYGDRMRLGDGERPLAVLVLWACNSLSLNSDIPEGRPLKQLADYKSNDMWALWGNTMEGGLKVILGAASELASREGENGHIMSFVRSLKSRTPLAAAWLTEAQPPPFDENRPRALFSGRDEKDCFARLNGMSLENFRQYPVLRDRDVGGLCWRTRVEGAFVDAFAKSPTAR